MRAGRRGGTVLRGPVSSGAARAGALALAVAVAALAFFASLRAGSAWDPASSSGGWVALAAGGGLGPAERLAAPAPNPPPLEAVAAVLMDAASGRVLYAKNAHRRMFPASITKIMTAYAVLRRLREEPGGVEAGLDRLVTVSRRAADQEGSSAGLRAGEQVSVRDLLYGLMLASGNDAAEALAEYVSGSRAAFAALCDRLAAGLGAQGTSFVNASGLPSAGHYTTAYDMALITRAALADPVFAQIVATRRYTGSAADGRVLTYFNENRLLGEDGVDGVKTGYTTQAGQTYVASATRDGMRLIAVVFRSSRWGKYRDATRLFNWGFAYLRPAALVPAGQAAQQVQVAGGDAYYVDLVLPPDAPTSLAVLPAESVQVRTDAPAVVRAPVDRGEVLGRLYVYLDGRPFGWWPLLAAWGVPSGSG